MFRVVLDERKKRELDPTLAMLNACIEEAAKDKETSEYSEQRLRDMQEFFQTTTGWYGHLRTWPAEAVTKLAKLGDKALKLLGFGA
jgi:DNA-binding transcriptional regulator GbsR (MarR family)